MDYSATLRVPNTKNSGLLNMLVKQETKLARITGYNIKLLEQSGVQLAKLVQKSYSSTKCHWNECAP